MGHGSHRYKQKKGRNDMNPLQHIHRDVYSVILAILVLAGLIALILALANPVV